MFCKRSAVLACGIFIVTLAPSLCFSAPLVIVDQLGKKARPVRDSDPDIQSTAEVASQTQGQRDYQQKVLNDPTVNEKARSMAVINQNTQSSATTNQAASAVAVKDAGTLPNEKTKKKLRASKNNLKKTNDSLIIQQQYVSDKTR